MPHLRSALFGSGVGAGSAAWQTEVLRDFAELYARLDETTKTNRKLAALREYFSRAEAADAAWAVYFLTGRKPKRLVKSTDLRAWAAEAAGVPDWLFEESYDAVGDLAETIAHLLPAAEKESERTLSAWVEEHLLPLRKLEEEEQREALRGAWGEMSARQRFVWNKLLTGAFRVGVSQRLVTRALADVSGLDASVVAHRLMGTWEPTPAFYTGLFAEDTGDVDVSRPYPFFLAHPLEEGPGVLGERGDWLAEWKWDGIRAQLLRREGQTFLWSRGEEIVTERFPEVTEPAALLPDGTVLDGEIVGWKDGSVLPFMQLQRRIGRKTLGKKILADVPARMIAFDLLEADGEDWRGRPLAQRRARLEEIVAGLPEGMAIGASQIVTSESWEELGVSRQRSREHNVEGLMLKRLDAPYGVGRERGPWWKWKIEPYTADAVMIYAQRGHGRRASLYSDYTFAVWDDGKLVPFAKAYSGLTDAEMRQVDRFVRTNTTERFGPVRAVKPELVFELAFENIQLSSRHKSGIAVRFPRMARWRKDKKPEDADTLETIRGMIRANERGGSAEDGGGG